MSLFFLLTICTGISAMDFTSVRLSIWTKGETIAGEEFIAATENVVDYMATLPRPTGSGFKSLKYDCQAKSRYIRPDLNSIGSNPPAHGWVEIRTLYDLKDCVAISE